MDEEAIEQRPRIDERQVAIEAVMALIDTQMRTTGQIANYLIKLDEMGCPIRRSGTANGKISEWLYELRARFNHDVVQGYGSQTAAQKQRAEEYELS